MLNSIDVDYVLNPLEKKLTEDELIQLVPDVDVIIAGTEQISARVIAHAPNLKLISRVGIGLAVLENIKLVLSEGDHHLSKAPNLITEFLEIKYENSVPSKLYPLLFFEIFNL